MILSPPNLITSPKGTPKYAELGIASFDLPFKVFILKKLENDTVTYSRGVYFESPLLKGVRLSETQEITGLLSSISPEDTDSGWKKFSIDQIDDGNFLDIWVEVAFSDSWPTITSATIKDSQDKAVKPHTTPFGGGELEYKTIAGTIPEYKQTYARITIARIKKVSDTPYVIQYVSSPLRLEYTISEARDTSENNPKTIGVKCLYTI